MRTYVPPEQTTSIASTAGSSVAATSNSSTVTGPRLAIDLDALAGQLVQPAAVDADRRDHRRDLLDVADEVLGDDPAGVVHA